MDKIAILMILAGIELITFFVCLRIIWWLFDNFWSKKKIIIGAGIILVLWAAGMGGLYYILNTDILESQEETTKLEEEYAIIKGKQQSEINGSGIGLLTFYKMNIESNDTFSFYFLNEDGEFERKKVDFDFVIKEENEDKAYFRVYEKYNIEKHCNRWTGECWEEEKHVNFSADKKVLIVPKGTIQKEPISLD